MAGSHCVSSIASIITLGLDLATTLETTLTADRNPERELLNLCSEISSTAGILRQLEQFLVNDEQYKAGAQGQVAVLKDAGLQEIKYRATQCEILYRTIISNVSKAGMAGWKNNIKTEGIDTTVLKITSISRGFRWPWLGPRIKKTLEQFQLVKLNLLLILGVANLAKHQCCTAQRVTGTFEVELAHRILVIGLKRRRYHCAKGLAKKYYVSPPSTANSSLVDLSLANILTHEEKVLLKLVESNLSWTVIRRRFNTQLSQNINVRALQSKCRRLQEKIRVNSPRNQNVIIDSTEGTDNDKAKKTVISVEKNRIEEIVVVGEGSSKPPPYAESLAIHKDIATMKKQEPIKEPAVILGSHPPPPPPPVLVEKNEPTQEPNEEAEVVIIDASHPIAKEKTKDIDMITMSTFKKQFGKVDSWFKELFGPSSLFFDDKESESLEAFMILGDQNRLKVPFGHRRLKFGMKKLMKAKKTKTLDDYYALPKNLQVAIHNVLLGAKIRDSRDRVVVCFDVLSLGDKVEDQHLLVFFFADGAPLKPVHFKDAVGRKFVVPYHLVQYWGDMKNMVDSAFLHVDILGPHVQEGHYDLLHNDEIILPSCWDGIIKPGMEITMHMWPMPDNRRPPPPRPWQGPGGGPPGCWPPPMRVPNVYPRSGFGIPLPGAVPLGPGPGPGNLGYPPRHMGPPPPPPPPGMLERLGPGPRRPGPGPRGPGLACMPQPPPRIPNAMRRGSYCSYSTDYGSDTSALGSCSDIENEEGDLGIQFDYMVEKKNAMIDTKELLESWTNALDVEIGLWDSSSIISGSGSDSSSSLADD